MWKMSCILFLILFFSFFPFPCFASDHVRLNGGVCVDLNENQEIETIPAELINEDNNQFWGLGWEVILRKIGMGGNYYTNFMQDEVREWTVQWYSEVFFLSYHFFGGSSFLDPFVQAGLGCAGSVYLGETDIFLNKESAGRLSLSIFPFVSAGLALNFDGYFIGAKCNYLPVIKPVPVTDIKIYDLMNTQLSLFAGLSF